MELNNRSEKLTPVVFVERWQHQLQLLDIPTCIDATGELIAVWKLVGRKLKYKRVEYNNCCFTLRVLQYNTNYVELQVGLLHATTKPRGPETTHWRTIILSLDDYSNKAILFSKLVISAANLTRQGKVEPVICSEWLNLIEQTLGSDQ